jgi:signal transduction histidine kinase
MRRGELIAGARRHRSITTKPTGEGTGLGLSMTHEIVFKQHGGRIDVETEPSVFTEFIIILPRDNATAIDQKSE